MKLFSEVINEANQEGKFAEISAKYHSKAQALYLTEIAEFIESLGLKVVNFGSGRVNRKIYELVEGNVNLLSMENKSFLCDYKGIPVSLVFSNSGYSFTFTVRDENDDIDYDLTMGKGGNPSGPNRDTASSFQAFGSFKKCFEVWKKWIDVYVEANRGKLKGKKFGF